MAKKETGGSGLSALPYRAIEKEIQRRARKARTLNAKRNRLVAKIAQIDTKIRELGGLTGGGGRAVRSAGTGRVRPQNETTLPEALAKVLKGKTMGVTEVAAAVQKAGYKTNAENFRTIVNQALIKHRSLFKKVERGQYTAA